MSKVFIEESTLSSIGSAIRSKTGGQDLISPLDMAKQIEGITSGAEIDGKEKIWFNLSEEEIPAGSFVTTDYKVTRIIDDPAATLSITVGYQDGAYQLNKNTMVYLYGPSSGSGYTKIIHWLDDGSVTDFNVSGLHPVSGQYPGILPLDEHSFLCFLSNKFSSYPPKIVTLNDDYTEASIQALSTSGSASSKEGYGGVKIVHLKDDLYLYGVLNDNSSYKDVVYAFRLDLENNSLKRLCYYDLPEYSVSARGSTHIMAFDNNVFIYILRGILYTLIYNEETNKISEYLPPLTLTGSMGSSTIAKIDNTKMFINLSGNIYIYNIETQELKLTGHSDDIYGATGQSYFKDDVLTKVTDEVWYIHNGSGQYWSAFMPYEGKGGLTKKVINNYSSTLNLRKDMVSVLDETTNTFRQYGTGYYSSKLYIWYTDFQVGIREAKFGDRIIGVSKEDIAPQSFGGCYGIV